MEEINHPPIAQSKLANLFFLLYQQATPDQKYMLDKIAMGALIAFFFTIQIVFALTLARSYRKIRELQKEELSFQQKIASCPYDLEEYDV